MKYREFHDEFLVAAYQESQLRPRETITSGELVDLYPLRFQPGWVVQLVNDLGVRGYLVGKGVDGGDRDQPIRLTGRGLRVAEELIERGVAIFRLDPGDGIGFPPDEKSAANGVQPPSTGARGPQEPSMMSYSEFERHLLVACYLVSENSTDAIIRIGDVIEQFGLEYRPGWINRAVEDFIQSGWSKDVRKIADELDQDVWLTAAGYRRAEELQPYVTLENRQASEPEPRVASIDDGNSTGVMIPASDRLVRIDHNLRDYAIIRDGIAEIREAIRTTNDLPLDDRERASLITSLEAAQTLWDAAQLKVIQIKIGILMAAEDARMALAATAKAVAAALLVDAIKAFVKSHTGIDLDHL